MCHVVVSMLWAACWVRMNASLLGADCYAARVPSLSLVVWNGISMCSSAACVPGLGCKGDCKQGGQPLEKAQLGLLVRPWQQGNFVQRMGATIHVCISQECKAGICGLAKTRSKHNFVGG